MIEDSLMKESPETPIPGEHVTSLESPVTTQQSTIYSLLVEWAELQPDVCRVTQGGYFLLGLCWAVNVRHAQENCFTPAELAGIREVVEGQAVEQGCILETRAVSKPALSSAMLINKKHCLRPDVLVKFRGSIAFAALEVWVDYLKRQAPEAQGG